ncbi:pentatricopeptide repeat-containing protein At3g05340 [Aristolochia californica]|uniref:pentatricopeptide repeat-containing protein At3g05340 n=1 Tax=Aristolochia californica TaxID=171875 RepID=UPI0035DD649C
MNALKANVLTHVNVSTLLSLCGKEGNHRLGSSLHALILKRFPVLDSFGDQRDDELLVISNSLISMYAKCGQVSDAEKIFESMENKDTISWNSIIWGFLAVQELNRGMAFFNRMRESNMYQPDKATITTLLSSSTERHLLYVVKMIHSVLIFSGYENEVPVGNALLTGYFKCGCPQSALKVFDEMPIRNVVTWTAVVSALSQNSLCRESFLTFSKMRRWVDANALTYSSSLQACSGMQALVEGWQIHGLVLKSGFNSDMCVESALMDMYSKCGCLEAALEIFKAAWELDEISMTVILTGLAQNGMVEEAVKLFVKIMKMGVGIDANMVSAVLGIFGFMTSLTLGKQVHSFVIKKQFCCNPFVCNGFINMYSKCGEFGESVKIFYRMNNRNSVSWNSIIAGYASHGHGYEALQVFEEMILEGVEPTDITFISLLQACSHVGSVEKGMQLLESMSGVHGLRPRMEHYACIVDLLGRAGYLEEAKKFIEGLPVEPTAYVWQALLGACNIYGNSKIGVYAASQLLQLDPNCTAAYVLMANIYSCQGRWKERASFIRKMKELGVQKEAGVSWVEVENKVHSFVVRDRIHTKSEVIYELLHCLYVHMGDAPEFSSL